MRLAKKNLVRVFAICLVLVMACALVMSSVSNAALTAGKSGKSTWVYMGAGKDGKAYKSTNTSNKQPKYTVKVGATSYVGYCINSDKGWGSGTSMTSRAFSSSKAVAKYSAAKQELLSYVLLFGYNKGVSAPYGNTNDYYAATQTLVWQVLDGKVVMDLKTGAWTKNSTSDKAYTLIKGHSYGVKCYDYIKKQMTAHVKGASFGYGTLSEANAKKVKMTYNYKNKNWMAVLNDTTGTFSYKMTAGAKGLTMSRSGSKYTFVMNGDADCFATLMNAKSFASQSAMVFDSGSSSTQSVALGATDTKKMYVAFEKAGEGKGRIIKVDEAGKRLAGFSFKVTNSVNGYEEIWTTGEDGTIAKDLYPGKYKVQEVLTAEQLKDNWLEAEAEELEIVEGETSSVEIVNEKNDKARLKIIKTVTDGGPLAGFNFRVVGLQDNAKHITVNDIIEESQPECSSDYEITDVEIADGSVIERMNADMTAGKMDNYTVNMKVVLTPVGGDGDDAGSGAGSGDGDGAGGSGDGTNNGGDGSSDGTHGGGESNDAAGSGDETPGGGDDDDDALGGGDSDGDEIVVPVSADVAGGSASAAALNDVADEAEQTAAGPAVTVEAVAAETRSPRKP